MNLLDLQKARGYPDLASLFKVSVPQLARSIYGPSPSYRTFQVPKRNGGTRLIESPKGFLRNFQEQLAPVLVDVYQPHQCAHGFISGRSIVSNSEGHVGKSLLVNIDLEDFFHSIGFRRVRGLFLKSPFAFDWRVANILAHLCCFKGRLPAGGITSPILSNLVAARLDKRLASLVARHGGAYSRYADDLTFSFNRPLYQISGIAARDADGNAALGAQLQRIVREEGFAINEKKTRIQEPGMRKMVTGLVVNQKKNVRRSWLRELDYLVHAASKFGAVSAASKLLPTVDPSVGSRILLRSIHGRLAYLYMVRGKGDWLTAELAWKFNSIHTEKRLRVPDTEFITQFNRLPRCALVLTCSAVGSPPVGVWDEQGTAFVSKAGLIVTADHVTKDEDGRPYPHLFVHNERTPTLRHQCDIVYSDAHFDIAVLRLRYANSDVIRIRASDGSDALVGQRIASVGFPAYFQGHQISRQEHEVTHVRVTSGVKKLVVTGNIQGGLSGAPVFDSACRLVGVVHRGLAGGGYANEIIAFSSVADVIARV